MKKNHASVRLLSAQLEDLDYTKLYSAYSSHGRKSAADPRVLFKVLVYGYQCGSYSGRKLEENADDDTIRSFRYRDPASHFYGNQGIHIHFIGPYRAVAALRSYQKILKQKE